MKYLIPLLIVFMIAGCKTEQDSSSDKEIPTEKAKVESNMPGTSDQPEFANLTIKRKFDYSNKFLNGLIASGVENATLDGNMLILDSLHRYTFPEFPEVFNMTAFFGHEGETHIKLIAERVNQSTISYILLAGTAHKLDTIVIGGAHLSGDFYAAEHIDTNHVNGQYYAIDEYIDLEDNCRTVLRIGQEDGQTKFHARISKTCDGKPVPLGSNKPILLTEK